MLPSLLPIRFIFLSLIRPIYATDKSSPLQITNKTLKSIGEIIEIIKIDESYNSLTLNTTYFSEILFIFIAAFHISLQFQIIKLKFSMFCTKNVSNKNQTPKTNLSFFVFSNFPSPSWNREKEYIMNYYEHGLIDYLFLYPIRLLTDIIHKKLFLKLFFLSFFLFSNEQNCNEYKLNL